MTGSGPASIALSRRRGEIALLIDRAASISRVLLRLDFEDMSGSGKVESKSLTHVRPLQFARTASQLNRQRRIRDARQVPSLSALKSGYIAIVSLSPPP